MRTGIFNPDLRTARVNKLIYRRVFWGVSNIHWLLDLGIPELIIQQALAATHLQLGGSPLRRPRWGIDRSLKPHRKPNDLENHEKHQKNRAETNEINNSSFFYQNGPFKSKSLPLWSFPIIRLESSKAPSEIPNQMNKNNNLNYPLAWYNPNCGLGGSTSRKNRNGTVIEQRHFLIWIKTASTIMIYPIE